MEKYIILKLKEDLKEKVNFQFDTEVILYLRYGIENTINTIDGMFSIAVWDKKEECIYLARDRVGIKPLYWTK